MRSIRTLFSVGATVVLFLLAIRQFQSLKTIPVGTTSEAKSFKTTNKAACGIIKRTLLYSERCHHVGDGNPRKVLITGVGRSGTTFIQQLLLLLGYKLSHDSWQSSCKLCMPSKSKNYSEKSIRQWKQKHYSQVKCVTCFPKHGAVSWAHAFYEADQSKFCYPSVNQTISFWTWLPHNKYFHRTIHIVRHPLKNILSRSNGGEFFKQNGITGLMQCRTYPSLSVDVDNGRASLIFALQHWVLWNSFISCYAHSTHQIESLNTPQAIISLLKDSQLPFTSSTIHQEISGILSQLGTKVNSNHTASTAEELDWNRLRGLDAPFSFMAQRLAIRYGYLQAQQAFSEALDPSMRMMCGFVAGGDFPTTVYDVETLLLRRREGEADEPDWRWTCGYSASPAIRHGTTLLLEVRHDGSSLLFE